MSLRSRILDEFAKTGRNHPYLALTVNSICNLDCVFCKPHCMPSYGISNKTLNATHYTAIASEAGRWGISKAHISGGEPTLRPDILEIIKALKKGLAEQIQIGITTHANLRKGLTVPDMKEAGLNSINISLHSLKSRNSKTIMGGGIPDKALETLHKALEIGLQVKINCVMLKSYIQDALDVAHLAKNLPVAVRLIELQRIGPAIQLFPTEYISEKEFRSLTDIFNKTMTSPRSNFRVRSPGTYMKPDKWAGYVAFISNSSCAICSDSNRIKITPTGMSRSCTLVNKDINLYDYLNRKQLENAFAHFFESMLNRNNNPSWKGYHFVDYDLRWDRLEPSISQKRTRNSFDE